MLNSLVELIWGTEKLPETVGSLISRIANAESEKCLQLSTNRAEANTQVRIRNRLRLTDKDLVLLWEHREVLPALTRLYVEDLYERRVLKKVPRELSLEDFRDKLYVLVPDHPWKRGRALARLICLLENFRVFLWTPPRPRRTHRMRTPSAAGGSGKTSGQSKVEFPNEVAYKIEQQSKYLREVNKQLEHATHLLAVERAMKSWENENQQTIGRELPAQSNNSQSENEALNSTSVPQCQLLDTLGEAYLAEELSRGDSLCQFCPPTYQRSCAKYCRADQERSSKFLID